MIHSKLGKYMGRFVAPECWIQPASCNFKIYFHLRYAACESMQTQQQCREIYRETRCNNISVFVLRWWDGETVLQEKPTCYSHAKTIVELNTSYYIPVASDSMWETFNLIAPTSEELVSGERIESGTLSYVTDPTI